MTERRLRVLFVSELTAGRDTDRSIRIPDAHRRRYGSYADHFDMTWTLTERTEGGFHHGYLPEDTDVVWLPGFSSGEQWLRTLPRLTRRLWHAVGSHDVVIVNTPCLAALPALAIARLRGVPAISLLLSRWVQLRRRPSTTSPVVSAMFTVATQLGVLLARRTHVAGSALSREVWRPLRGRTSTVVYPGIGEEDLVEQPAPGERSATSMRLLTVARFIDTKRLDVVVRGAAELRDRGHQIHLTVVGDGVERAALSQLVVDLGLTDVVSLTGWIDDWGRLGDLYRDSFAFVFASEDEALPLVIMEAMAVGLPVVSTPAGGLETWLSHERDALLIPEADPHALANSVERLHDDPALRARVIAAARTRVSPLTREAWLRWLDDELRALVTPSGRRSRLTGP